MKKREHLHHVLSQPFFTVIHKFCCTHTHLGIKYLPLSNHFSSFHIFSCYHQALTSQHHCDCESNWFLLFSLSSTIPTGRLIVAVQQSLAPGEDSIGTFFLSFSAEPGAVTAPFPDCVWGTVWVSKRHPLLPQPSSSCPLPFTSTWKKLRLYI